MSREIQELKDELNRITRHLHYLHGRLEAQTDLILAVATQMPKELFRQQSLEKLETSRRLLLTSDDPNADTRRKAIDDTEHWVRTLTDS